MVRKTYSSKALAGLVFTVVGIGLGIWGYRMSGSVGARMNELFTGAPGDKVVFVYIGAAVCITVGIYLLGKK